MLFWSTTHTGKVSNQIKTIFANSEAHFILSHVTQQLRSIESGQTTEEFKTKHKAKIKLQEIHWNILFSTFPVHHCLFKNLSDPGVPRVWSMGPDVCPQGEVVETLLMWL